MRARFGRHALGRLLGPEVAEAVHAHDGHAFARQELAHCLVEVAPAAVARVDHRHPGAGAGGRELDEGEARERLRAVSTRIEGGGDERDQPIGRRSRTRRRYAVRGEGGEVRRERRARGDAEEARQVGLAGVGEATAGNGSRRRPRAERHLRGERQAPDRRRRRRRPSRPAPARAPRRRGSRLPRHRPGSEIDIHRCRDRAGRACSDPRSPRST